MSAAGSGSAPDGSVAKLIEIAEPPTLGQRLISWASRPPGRLYIPACAAVALILVFEDSVPAGHLPAFTVGLVCGLLLAAMGALRLGIALAVARPMIRHYWLRWVSAPLIAATALALSGADVPLQLRMAASTDQLLELAGRVEDGGTAARDGAWTGAYPLDEVSVSGDLIHFTVDGAGLLDPAAGFAHSAQDLPVGVFVPGQGSRIYEHVSGDWYVWVSH
ncbi:hypothetical protein [Nocardiopsis lucentensis]|uniref:hypothetical protein n=1 Tax=Nocardiopsis lucentensis TaxID=53441 RepID=UPI00034555CA|nr:hypothetical protein [Nocardiopsis lucentensis]